MGGTIVNYCPKCGSNDVEGDEREGYVCFSCRARFNRPSESPLPGYHYQHSHSHEHHGAVEIESGIFKCEACNAQLSTLTSVQYKCYDCGITICPRCAGQEELLRKLLEDSSEKIRCPRCRHRYEMKIALWTIGAFIAAVFIIVVLVMAFAEYATRRVGGIDRYSPRQQNASRKLDSPRFADPAEDWCPAARFASRPQRHRHQTPR
jgi:DNA-directed RNA polymerase subunit RPC12/RpoP